MAAFRRLNREHISIPQPAWWSQVPPPHTRAVLGLSSPSSHPHALWPRALAPGQEQRLCQHMRTSLQGHWVVGTLTRRSCQGQKPFGLPQVVYSGTAQSLEQFSWVMDGAAPATGDPALRRTGTCRQLTEGGSSHGGGEAVPEAWLLEAFPWPPGTPASCLHACRAGK